MVTALGLDLARWDVVCSVVAGLRVTSAEAETTLDGFEQPPNGITASWNFYLHALVAFAVDDGISLAALIVEVLGDVQRALMTFVAEGSPPLMHVVGMGAEGAMGCMTSKGFHDVPLVVTGRAGKSNDGVEVDMSMGERRHSGW